MTETKLVKVYIDGDLNDVREVEARIMSDQPSKAFTMLPVVCKFRTGNKLHTSYPVAWLQPNGMFRINRNEVIHNRHSRVLRFKDLPEQTNSGWTG